MEDTVPNRLAITAALPSSVEALPGTLVRFIGHLHNAMLVGRLGNCSIPFSQAAHERAPSPVRAAQECSGPLLILFAAEPHFNLGEHAVKSAGSEPLTEAGKNLFAQIRAG